MTEPHRMFHSVISTGLVRVELTVHRLQEYSELEKQQARWYAEEKAAAAVQQLLPKLFEEFTKVYLTQED